MSANRKPRAPLFLFIFVERKKPPRKCRGGGTNVYRTDILSCPLLLYFVEVVYISSSRLRSRTKDEKEFVTFSSKDRKKSIVKTKRVLVRQREKQIRHDDKVVWNRCWSGAGAQQLLFGCLCSRRSRKLLSSRRRRRRRERRTDDDYRDSARVGRRLHPSFIIRWWWWWVAKPGNQQQQQQQPLWSLSLSTSNESSSSSTRRRRRIVVGAAIMVSTLTFEGLFSFLFFCLVLFHTQFLLFISFSGGSVGGPCVSLSNLLGNIKSYGWEIQLEIVQIATTMTTLLAMTRPALRGLCTRRRRRVLLEKARPTADGR